ncbi:MAG: DUF2085 domain-containing protein [Coriobacteriales bacterium]|jgi:uncharacterized membrane protein|nr:DUF2085 domain-containing protein [Coriobacteriales bacterium]
MHCNLPYNGLMQEFLYIFGHGFCHQIPERSLVAGDLYFPVCARDTGIYIGLAAAIIACFAVYARAHPKPGNLAPWPVLAGLCCMIVPMAFDGLSSYLGLRETTNLIRYITGLLTGVGAGTVFAPLLLALRQDADPAARAFAAAPQLAAQLLLALGLGAAFYLTYPLLGAVATMVPVLSLLLAGVSLSLLILGQNQRFAPHGQPRRWLVAVLISLLIVLAVVLAFALLRYLLLDRWLGDSSLWLQLS